MEKMGIRPYRLIASSITDTCWKVLVADFGWACNIMGSPDHALKIGRENCSARTVTLTLFLGTKTRPKFEAVDVIYRIWWVAGDAII